MLSAGSTSRFFREVGLARAQVMHNFLTKVAACLLNFLLGLLYRSNRLTITGRDVIDRHVRQGGNIIAFWHSRLLYLTIYYARNPLPHKFSVLISMSRDGDYGAALGDKMNADVIRGSSSRGGRAAVRKLAASIAERNNVTITPDGPRGPARKVNDGVIKLAQLTGAKIIPVSYDASRKRQLKSWDRFLVVLPFGRVHLALAEPIEVPRHISTEERAEYCGRLERTLRHLDEICAAHVASGRSEAAQSEGQETTPSQHAKTP